MTKLTFRFILLFLLFSIFHSKAQLPAFPTAYGAGAYTNGGRGGKVIHVTSLRDILNKTDPNYVGTLRWALQAPANKTGNRTIVFDVSGIIDLQDIIYVSNIPGDEGGYDDNLSILGQSAPMGGITIIGESIKIKGVNHLTIRYLKFRITGDYGGALSCGNADNIIYDHLSGSHCPNSILFSLTANGENIQADKHTIQNCLVGNSKNGVIIGNSDFAQGSTVIPYGSVSVLRNAFYNVGWRVPGKFGGAGKFDVINNVAHNWSERLMRTDPYPFKMNHIGNYYQSGAESRIRGYPNLHKTYVIPANGEPKIYQEDNYYSDDVKNNAYNKPNQWSVFQGEDSENVPASYFANTIQPIQGRAFTIVSSSNIKNDVLEFVGASKYMKDDGTVGFYRDQYDTFQVNGIAVQDVQYGSNRNIQLPVQSISNTRPNNFYASNPHIPEVWFQAHVPAGQDHNDIAPSGYTWLEEYLNGVDGPPASAINVQSIAVNPSTAELQIAETLQLTATFTPSNATNQNGIWSTSNADIATVDANGLVTAISSGDVTITFTSADGSFTDTSEITVFPEAFHANAGIDQQICEGKSTTLTASGGSTYQWSTGETTSSITITPDATTTYTVIAFDASGINSDMDEVTVSVNAFPTANAGIDVATCRGTSVTLSASGGDTYLWDNGATTQNITVNPNSTKTYTVEVTQNGCSDEDEVIVTVNQIPNVNAGINHTINIGESATLSANGATSFQWNTGETSESITVNPTTTTNYTVVGILDGCEGTDSVTVTVLNGDSVSADAGQDVSICEGNNTILTASGGATYQWSNGATTSSITVNPTTTTAYTVTVFSANELNSDTDDVKVTVNPLPSANAGADVSICRGTSVTLSATDGGNYLWSTGASTQSITVSPNTTKTYTVEVSNNGCSDSDDVKVTVNPLPNANAGVDVSTCRGTSVTLTATGGESYLWSTGATTQNITVNPNSTKTYTVEVTQNGCSDEDEVTVRVNPIPNVNAGINQTIYLGESATLTANGATSYQWNTGATTQSINVSPTTTTNYTVMGILGGCEGTDSVTVTVLNGGEVSANAGQDVSICEGNNTLLTASGGATYQWSNGATTSSITVNPTATTTYTVTVFSANGQNSDTDDVKVTVKPMPIANAGNDVSTCRGTSVTLTATGGGSYLWSTGATTQNITVNPNTTKTYSVAVSQNGCTDTDDVTVTINSIPTVDAGNNQTITNGENITLTANGATSYRWNTGQTTQSIVVSPNLTTTYIVTGTSNGCEATDTVTVFLTENNGNFNANAGQDVAICQGNGTTLTASGGSTYRWSNGATTASINVNPNATTTYSVIAYDASGTNSDTDEVIVTVNSAPNIRISSNFTINSGQTVILSAFGAETYSWSNGQTGMYLTVSPTVTTTYTVIGTNSSGCRDTASVTITVSSENNYTSNAGANKSACSGSGVSLNASGGDTYLWSTGETTQSIFVNPNNTTTYSVVAYTETTEITDEVTVHVDPNPAVSILNGDEVTILEGEYVTLSARGANRYRWNNGATQPNIAVNPDGTTTYSVTGYINDCSDLKDVVVKVVPKVIAFAGEDQNVCLNEMAKLTATGGDEYLWNTGETTQSINVTPTSDTEYSVTVYNDLDYGTSDVMVYVNDCAASQIPEDPEDFEFLVYPNPTTGNLNIKISGLQNVSNIYIFDIAGKVLHEEALSTVDFQIFEKTLDLSNFPDGLYILKLVDDRNTITKKIVVHK